MQSVVDCYSAVQDCLKLVDCTVKLDMFHAKIFTVNINSNCGSEVRLGGIDLYGATKLSVLLRLRFTIVC